MEYRYLKNNVVHLQQELNWLASLVKHRAAALKDGGAVTAPGLPPVPVFKGTPSLFSDFVKQMELNPVERLILALALQPHISPGLLEKSLMEAGVDPSRFPEMGCLRTAHYHGMMPTGETALFLAAGPVMEDRIRTALYFNPAHKFATLNILKLDEVGLNEPVTSGILMVSNEVLHMLTSGTEWKPAFNNAFPAKQITTQYTWDDLVLNPETKAQLDELRDWLAFRKELMKGWGFQKHSNGGYKCLFYGPPGTGKSLAAAVLGSKYNLPVYRIDLSMIISKYIGETEKNVSNIFDRAAGRDWILFFDEADALFGKRTNIQNSNDRYANQEVSYLLMRMEEYSGLAILATNLRTNIDRAFLRRFQNVVHFSIPEPAQRYKIWKNGMPPVAVLHEDLCLKRISETYSLSGANIMNVIRFSSIKALKAGGQTITQEMVLEGIRRELAREAGVAGE